MRARTGISVPPLLLLLAVGIPGAMTATAPPLSASPVCQEAPDTERAVELEARADVLQEDSKSWARAARLLRQAAECRSDTDPAKLRNLVVALRLNHHSGRHSEALRDATSAANLALRRGEVVEAAERYLDAALLASEVNRPEEAMRHADQAQLLTHSPLLTAVEQRRIQRRLGEVS